MTNKKTTKTKTVKDYLRLPFEVHYADLSITTLELFSDVLKVKHPEQFKCIHLEQGTAYGVTFFCKQNTGKELICCLTEEHDDTCPDWLSMLEEDEINMNHGEDFGVEIDDSGLNLKATVPDDFEDLEPTGYAIDLYGFFYAKVEYIILDAEGDRIKIDAFGYGFDENDEPDENLLLIDIDELSQDESLNGWTTLSYAKAQNDWINSVWKKSFPKLPPPTISNYVI